eukprot:12928407-Prorocentrum_lima.AAC.1
MEELEQPSECTSTKGPTNANWHDKANLHKEQGCWFHRRNLNQGYQILPLPLNKDQQGGHRHIWGNKCNSHECCMGRH